VLDSSTYLNNGLVAAGSIPAWTYGYLTFDGVNDYVKVPDSATLPDDRITISAWVYLNSYKDDQVIVAKEYGTASPYSSYRLGLGAYSESRKLQMRLGTSGTRKVITSASDIPLNQWTHVACVYNRSTVTLYINGAVDYVRKYVYGAITLSDNPLYVGMGQYDNTYFAGSIDEVRIYNAALSDSEIAALAQN
jgi:arabinan endo-1,5-alpha-L-arabinosidase